MILWIYLIGAAIWAVGSIWELRRESEPWWYIAAGVILGAILWPIFFVAMVSQFLFGNRNSNGWYC